MTDIDRDDWTRKIAALLRKAEGTDNEHEAAAFLAKAQDLMVQHAIDEQAIREANHAAGRPAEAVTKADFMYSTTGDSAVGKFQLLAVAARAAGCRAFTYGARNWSRRGQEPGKYEFNKSYGAGHFQRWGVIVGYPSDIETAKMLYQSLLIQATRFGIDALKAENEFRFRPVGKSAFMTGFLSGFSLRVQKRLRDAETQTVAASGTALILHRDAAVDAAVADFFPNLGTGKQKTLNGAGMAAGWEAGARADIGQTKVAQGAARLTGGD
jgi:hypothetical protein